MTETAPLRQDEQKSVVSKNKVQDVFNAHKANKYKMKNSTLEFRLKKLRSLKKIILLKQESIELALYKDFNRPHTETAIVELLPVISEINHVCSHLGDWMKDKAVKTPPFYTGSKSWVRYEARGTCLLIGPWNYPFHLVFYPLISAIAAGNTVIVKPSEFTPHINKVIKEIVQAVFEENEVALFEGDAKLASELLDLEFEHIFFTGSTRVGKIVMEKASKHLASVTLELGGKSPVIVDRNVDIDEAAHKIAWGKFLNAGQTCIAPDYLYIHEDMVTVFSDAFKRAYDKLTHESDHKMTSIINEAHFNRLKAHLDDAKAQGAQVELGAQVNLEERKIEMTLLSNVSDKCSIMQEEIFGPILPIKTYLNEDEIYQHINSHGHPLAIYIFSKSNEFINRVLEKTCSGGVAINDVILQNANHNLPFGGVGPSGLGHYHGQWGFEEFSHKRAVFKRKLDIGLKYFYPPYTQKKKDFVQSLFNKFSNFF